MQSWTKVTSILVCLLLAASAVNCKITQVPQLKSDETLLMRVG